MSSADLPGKVLYDGFWAPNKSSDFRRFRIRALIVAVVGLTGTVLLGYWLAQMSAPWNVVIPAVFLPPVTLATLEPVLSLKGERDALKILADHVELPTRTHLQALLGRPNPRIDLASLVAVYIPSLSLSRSNYVAFEDADGRVFPVRARDIGDATAVRELLEPRGVKFIRDHAPPNRVVWTGAKWIQRRRA